MLAENDGRTWLLWHGKRSPVDLNDRAVTDALGFGADAATPRPIATGPVQHRPGIAAAAAPPIPGAGEPPRSRCRCPRPWVPSWSLRVDSRQYDAPLRGAARRPAARPARAGRDLAQHEFLRARPAAPPRRGRGVTDARRRRHRHRASIRADPVDPGRRGRRARHLRHWAKPDGASVSALTLLSGAALPLPDRARAHSRSRRTRAPGSCCRRATATSSRSSARSRARRPRARCSGSATPAYATGSTPREEDKTVEALGLTAPPLPIPWSVLSLFAAGPTLSRNNACWPHTTRSSQTRAAQAEETR